MTVRTLRGGVVAASSVGLALLVALIPAAGANAADSPTCPKFNANAFHAPTTITNRYFPLTPGDVYTYKGFVQKETVDETVTVTRNTKKIAGVTTVEIHDQVTTAGEPSEDTLDWYAQDDAGNVWYFGEFATDLPSGDHAGSWTAGVNGAKPGYIMQAAPDDDDPYCQENARGVAQDAAEVVSLSASRSVPLGAFSDNILMTRDFSLIESGSEHKFYAPGVGLIEAIAINGPKEDIKLVSREQKA
jgi:hypothetical protein